MTTEGELYDYYLPDELLATIREKFDVKTLVRELVEKCRGKDPTEIEKLASQILGERLKESIKAAIEVGEKVLDRTAEWIYKVAQKTGIRFPSVPQRFIEAHFMAARKNDKYEIRASTPSFMEFEVKRCEIFDLLRKSLGDDAMRSMPCRYGCILASKTLFEALKFDVEILRHSEMSKDGKCRIEIKLKSG
ncbi:MAG: hypothetical protein ACTSXJ_10315 [Candidatus Baldrarchaeia archaeon]